MTKCVVIFEKYKDTIVNTAQIINVVAILSPDYILQRILIS